MELKIEFTEEELSELVKSIENAPVGGYGQTDKNKKAYSIPTKKLAKMLAEKVNAELQKTVSSDALNEAKKALEAQIPTNLENGEGEYSLKQRNTDGDAATGFQLNNPSSPNDKGEFIREVTGKSSALFAGDNSVSVPHAVVGGDGNVYDGAAAGSGIQAGRYNHAQGDDILQGGSQNYTGSNRTLQTGNLNKIKKNSYNSAMSGSQNTIGENSQNSTIDGLGNEIKDNCPYSRESGRNNKVNSPNQAVDGYFNEENEEAIYMVGNGDEPTKENGWKTTRKNAFEVLRDGRATVQSPPKNNKDVVRKLEHDTKYDKAGGIIEGDVVIQGNLSVTGTTTTKDTETVQVKENIIVANSDGVELIEEGGFAIKKSTTQAYGIMYDPVGDGVKIGLGSFDENGKFNYDDGEAQFLATRDDKIANGNLVEWNDEEKKLVDTGKKKSDFLPASAASGFIPTAAIGAARGVAPLGGDKAVPFAFLEKYGANIRYGERLSAILFREYNPYEPTNTAYIEHSIQGANTPMILNPWTLYYDRRSRMLFRFHEGGRQLIVVHDETKSYYTKTETDKAISNAISLLQGIREILPVESLPTEAISTTTMYLVKAGDDAGSEYLYVNGKWEVVGTTKVDTSKLVTVTDYERHKQELEGKVLIATVQVTEEDVANGTNEVSLDAPGATEAIGFIDWGDGATASSETSHQYSVGKYVCKFYANSMTTIPEAAFYNWKILRKIIIPTNITLIDAFAFRGCSNLSDVEILDGDYDIAIGNSAFYACTSLKTITLPNAVTRMGTSVFYNCTNLTSVEFKQSTPIPYDETWFNKCKKLAKIFVPHDSLEEYKTQWSKVSDKIDSNVYKSEVPKDLVFGYQAVDAGTQYPIKRNGYYMCYSNSGNLNLYKSDGTIVVEGAKQIQFMAAPFVEKPTSTEFKVCGMYWSGSSVLSGVEGFRRDTDDGGYITADTTFYVSQMIKE